jgi:hypothetical protein
VCAFRVDRPPLPRDRVSQLVGTGEFSPVRTVGADKIGVAKPAYRLAAVGLVARPQIATGETAEHGRPPALRSLPLKGVDDFFDGVIHATNLLQVRLCRT